MDKDVVKGGKRWETFSQLFKEESVLLKKHFMNFMTQYSSLEIQITFTIRGQMNHFK